MGGPPPDAPDAPPSPALLIQHALDESLAGNPLEYLRLQHALRGTSPAALAPILTGLSHFAVRLHADTPESRALRALFVAALHVDVAAVAAHHAPRTALRALLLNLISAHAAFVEPVLHFAARAFAASVDVRARLVDAVYDVIAALLRTHPRAARLLTATLRARYPHPVRPADEHVAYARALLHVARASPGPVARALTAAVFERLAAIEALVPPQLADDGAALVLEADKIQRVLLELFSHFEAAAPRSDYVEAVFEPAYAAYEAYVVPCDPRFTPYTLLFAAAVNGTALVDELVERLRQSFFDPAQSDRLRERFLEHSSAVVIRAKAVSSPAARKWIAALAAWLNAYIDALQRRGEPGEVDADVHRLFYTACAALMTTLTQRSDALAGRDDLATMRVFRIMASDMNPFLILPRGLVEDFVDAAHDVSAVDFGEIIEENRGRYTPSRTRYGMRNEFEYNFRCPDLELLKAAERVEPFARWDRRRTDGTDVEMEDGDVGTPVSSDGGASPRVT